MKIIFINCHAYSNNGVSIMTSKRKFSWRILSTIDNIKVETYNVNVGVTKYISKMIFDSALANFIGRKFTKTRRCRTRTGARRSCLKQSFTMYQALNSRLVLFLLPMTRRHRGNTPPTITSKKRFQSRSSLLRRQK